MSQAQVSAISVQELKNVENREDRWSSLLQMDLNLCKSKMPASLVQEHGECMVSKSPLLHVFMLLYTPHNPKSRLTGFKKKQDTKLA